MAPELYAVDDSSRSTAWTAPWLQLSSMDSALPAVLAVITPSSPVV